MKTILLKIHWLILSVLVLTTSCKVKQHLSSGTVQLTVTDSIASPIPLVTIKIQTNKQQQTYAYIGGEGNTISAYSVNEVGKFKPIKPYKISKKYTGIRGLTTITINNTSFLIVGNKIEGTIQVYKQLTNGELKKVSQFQDTDSTFLKQNVTIEYIPIKDKHFLLVGGIDTGISSFQLTEKGALQHIQSLEDNATTFLNGIIGMTTQVINEQVYLFCSGFIDEGISSFRVHNDGTFENVCNIGDNQELFLNGAFAVNSIQLGKQRFLLASHRHKIHYTPDVKHEQDAYHGDAVTVFKIHDNGEFTFHSVLKDTENTLLKGTTRIETLKLSEKKALVFIASRDDKGIQVCTLNHKGILQPKAQLKTGYSIYNGMAVEQVNDKWFLFAGAYHGFGMYCYKIK